jgi:hypothetical protein
MHSRVVSSMPELSQLLSFSPALDDAGPGEGLEEEDEEKAERIASREG